MQQRHAQHRGGRGYPTPHDDAPSGRASPRSPASASPAPRGRPSGRAKSSSADAQAVRIDGCRASFGAHLDLNIIFEPIPWEFNGKRCWVARGEAKLYLFHTKKARWVIGQRMDDGSRCYAYLTDNGNSSTPSDCERSGGKWSTGGSDGSWSEEPSMRSSMIPASQDKFVRLRLDMEAEMKSYGLTESKDLKALWKKMDKDGNNEIEISEVLDLTQELVKSGIWPKWMSYKDALEQAFQTTLEESDAGDHSLHQEEFHDLLLNMF